MTNTHYLLTVADAAAEGGVLEAVLQFAPIVLVLVIFYFLAIRPQQKKDKEDKVMRENLDIGDEVVTIGGIVGIVTKIAEDTVVIETGSDKSKIRILKNAVSQNITAKEKAEQAK